MGIFMLNMVTNLSGSCMLLADNEKYAMIVLIFIENRLDI